MALGPRPSHSLASWPCTLLPIARCLAQDMHARIVKVSHSRLQRASCLDSKPMQDANGTDMFPAWYRPAGQRQRGNPGSPLPIKAHRGGVSDTLELSYEGIESKGCFCAA